MDGIGKYCIVYLVTAESYLVKESMEKVLEDIEATTQFVHLEMLEGGRLAVRPSEVVAVLETSDESRDERRKLDKQMAEYNQKYFSNEPWKHE